MITKQTVCEVHFKDQVNKVYDEKFTLKVYLLGIRIWQRTMDRKEYLPDTTKTMGFK